MPTPKSPDDTILTLAKYGLDTESIATLVSAPVSEVRATLVTHRSRVDPDAELKDEAREFVRLALNEATLFMRFGLPSQKLALIRTVLPAAMRALGAADESSGEETHAQLQVLFHEIRSVPGAPKTISEPIDASSEAVTETTFDQD